MEHRPENPYEKPASTNDETRFPRAASSATPSGTDAGITSVHGSGDNGSADSAHEMVGRVAQGAHATIDKIADRATPQVQRLQDGYRETEQLVHRNAEQVRDKAHEWTDGLRVSVREHPLTAVATALAAGMLLARLSR